MTKFSDRLKDIRNRSGKKQREVADHLGMKLRSYQYYEEGRSTPSIEKLIKLADFFDVSLDYLLGRYDQ